MLLFIFVLFIIAALVYSYFKLALNKHKAALNAELARLKIRAKAVNNDDLLSDKVKSQGQ